MKNRKVLMIILCIVLLLVVGCQIEMDSDLEVLGHSDSSPLGNGEWSDKFAEQANFVLILSNQSPYSPTIQGYIDNTPIFQGRYKSKYLDSYYYYYADLEVGKYVLSVQSDDGATSEELLEIREDEDALWVYITYRKRIGTEPRLNLIQSHEMIGLD
jgi:hypothetical protein